MGVDRDVWFIDRWGAQIEDDISVEGFAALLDALNDSGDWFVEFTSHEAATGAVAYEEGVQRLAEWARPEAV